MADLNDLRAGPDPSTPEVLRAWVIDLVDRVAELQTKLADVERRLNIVVIPQVAELQSQMVAVTETVAKRESTLTAFLARLEASTEKVLNLARDLHRTDRGPEQNGSGHA